MIVSDLFEATAEIPIASGVVNPATGRVWLPSELAASRARRAAKNIQQAKLATATQVARDEMDNPPTTATIPTATSSTAPAPSSVTYSGALAPKKKTATPNFAKTGFDGYKLPGTSTVPTVPNMTKSPAAPAKAKTGGRVAGAPLSQTPNAVRKRAARAAATTPQATEPTAMGNMSRQLAARGQAQTSTGGATIATGTGVRHAASPTNPNQTTTATTSIPTANTGIQDIVNRLTGQIRAIKNRDDLKKVKQNIDREFTRKGVVTESAFVKRDILVKRANAKLARVLK